MHSLDRLQLAVHFLAVGQPPSTFPKAPHLGHSSGSADRAKLCLWTFHAAAIGRERLGLGSISGYSTELLRKGFPKTFVGLSHDQLGLGEALAYVLFKRVLSKGSSWLLGLFLSGGSVQAECNAGGRTVFVLHALRGRHLPKTISYHPWSHQGTYPAHPFQATLL